MITTGFVSFFIIVRYMVTITVVIAMDWRSRCKVKCIQMSENNMFFFLIIKLF